jgi:hypothetical protein
MLLLLLLTPLLLLLLLLLLTLHDCCGQTRRTELPQPVRYSLLHKLLLLPLLYQEQGCLAPQQQQEQQTLRCPLCQQQQQQQPSRPAVHD